MLFVFLYDMNNGLLMIKGLRNSLAQLVRYGLIGLTVNLSGYLIFLLVTYLGMGPKLSMTLLYLAGASAGFWGNRNWTFRDKGSFLGPGLKYLGAHAFGYLLNLTILLVFVDGLHYSYRLMQIVAIFVVAGFLFVAFKYFVFVRPGKAQEIRQ
ncbi:hypothetical protein R69927_04655 [Paraburkholderia domus]|nr:hypothetical protein R69927_04655 [Paraburkholderia domus]